MAFNYFVSAMLVFGLLVTLSLDFTVGEIGVCYGRNGNNLLAPRDVVQLYKRHDIRRMRTYDPDYAILDALRGSGIDLNVVITNQFIERLARDQNAANDWVRNHVTNYGDVNYKYISVGNEVSPADGATSRYTQFVLPAMRNIYRAICRAGLGARVKVTTTVGMSVLGNSFPPEDGAFRDDVVGYLRPILSFAASTGAPFMANIYPYFAYINNKRDIDLGYALLEENHGIEVNGVYYDNLFFAMVDAMYAAMDRIAPSSVQKVSPRVPIKRGDHYYNGTEELRGRPKIVRGDTGYPLRGGNYNGTEEPRGRRCGRGTPKIVRGDTGYPSRGGDYNGTEELVGRRCGPPKIVRGDTGNLSRGGDYNGTEELRGKRRGRGTPKLITGETGYPSRGGDSANMLNAKTYNQNLVDVVDDGTPNNPEPIETYIFALFDENEKPGAETERNFGLFYPNGQPKYDMNFN